MRTNPTQIISHLRDAAYISAVVTALMVLIEVPIVVLYIISRYIIIFISVCFGMAVTWLLIKAWEKVTSSSTKETADA